MRTALTLLGFMEKLSSRDIEATESRHGPLPEEYLAWRIPQKLTRGDRRTQFPILHRYNRPAAAGVTPLKESNYFSNKSVNSEEVNVRRS